MTETKYEDYKYNEYRYYNISESKGYDALLNELSQINTSLPGDSTHNYSLNQNLVKYFDITNFETVVFADGAKIHVPATFFNSDTSSSLYYNGGEFNRGALWGTGEGNTNTVLGKQENQKLKTYYDGIDSIPDEGSILNMFMKSAAKLTVEYFVYTTILYASMYKNTSIEGIENTFDSKVTFPSDSDLTKFTSALRDDSDEQNNINSIFAQDNGSKQKPLDMCVLIDAIYDIDEQLNTRLAVYNDQVHENMKMNTDFKYNNSLLTDKQNEFDKEKSKLITVMGKKKKIQNQYADKSFWYMLYILLLVCYIISLFGITFANNAKIPGLKATDSLTGSILILIAGMVFCSILFYDVLKYFLKF